MRTERMEELFGEVDGMHRALGPLREIIKDMLKQAYALGAMDTAGTGSLDARRPVLSRD